MVIQLRFFFLLRSFLQDMLGKVPVNIAAAGASPTETSAWEDLEQPSGPSLSPRAGSVLAKTIPSLFAQPVPKTSRDAEPPTSFSDPAAQRLCSAKRRDPHFTILGRILFSFI